MKRFKLVALSVAAVAVCATGIVFAGSPWKLTPQTQYKLRPTWNGPSPNASGSVRTLYTLVQAGPAYEYYAATTAFKVSKLVPNTVYTLVGYSFGVYGGESNVLSTFTTDGTGAFSGSGITSTIVIYESGNLCGYNDYVVYLGADVSLDIAVLEGY